jgi:hypothetical protein
VEEALRTPSPPEQRHQVDAEEVGVLADIGTDHGTEALAVRAVEDDRGAPGVLVGRDERSVPAPAGEGKRTEAIVGINRTVTLKGRPHRQDGKVMGKVPPQKGAG